jgi:flagellar hook-associated protein 1 FlgK
MREEFLDIQTRTENKSLGEWETKANLMNKLEVVFNEPSDNSLASIMDTFWGDWQELSKDPESVAARTVVMQQGVTLVNTFNYMSTQFQDLQSDINNGIDIKVNEVNSYTRQIADLNQMIIKSEAAGSKANDLRDQRELILEKLSKLISVDVTEDQFGAINVSVGGGFLVDRTVTSELRFTNNFLDPTKATLERVDPATNTSLGSLNLSGGVIKGYLDMRDSTIPSYQEKIDTLAKTIADKVNEIHQNGYDLNGEAGEDFFTKNNGLLDFSASNIRINQDILDNVNNIAAASSAPPDFYQGDGSNALLIAQLKEQRLMSSGAATFDDFYRSTVGDMLGVQSQEAQRMEKSKSGIIELLKNQQDSVAGVSLDEEMANMVKFQHAYNASAKMIQTISEVYDTLINKLGVG